MRRRTLVSKLMGSNALYPLKNGTHVFNCGFGFTITNGNHIRYSNYLKGSGGGYLQDFELNTKEFIDANNYSMKPKTFSLKKGDVCVLKVKNVKLLTKGEINNPVNLRIANSSNSLKFSTKIDEAKDYTTEETIEKDEEVAGLFFFMNSGNTVISWEYDVEFYVNGERWI